MSSQPPSLASKASANTSKGSAASSQISPAPSLTQQFFSSDSRRAASSSGGASGNHNASARNNQGAKPKHKSGKKFRMVDDDADAEQFSMQNPSGRRGQQSITHLMQFALPPRPQDRQQYGRYGGGRTTRRTWGLGSGHHAVDKARYIHANYRFIVDPRGDYHPQSEDADVHLDWSNVLQIIASSKTQTSSCPICLGEPTAPRMAKCGHIFCLPCLIRYMHSEDANTPSPTDKKARWKKCPICWDSIYISETRAVRFYTGQENDLPREGGDIVLRLVKRRPGSTLAMPRENADTCDKGEAIPWYSAAEVMDYARVMKGSEDYMMKQYDEALAAIEQLEKEDELMFGEDTEWTGRATRMLKESKEKVNGIGNPPEQPNKPEHIALKEQRPLVPSSGYQDGISDILQREQDTFNDPSGNEGSIADDASTSDTSAATHSYVPRTLNEMRQRQTEKPQPSEYLFYHALQHFYLSPLDIRILKAAFGTYSAFPSSILPRVERVSSGHVVDDELRKRVKYLAHLPYGCEVGFLECDWADTVNQEVLKDFQAQIERRRRRNEEKEAREEKERVRIEKASEKEYAAIRRTTKRTSLPDDFFSADQMPTTAGSATEGSLPDGVNSSSPPWPQRTTSAFASLASPSTSPSAHRTVWGTAVVAPASPDAHATLPPDATFTQDDGWLQDWERDLLAESELAVQMESLDVATSSKQVGKVGGGGGGKKGKKGKKITLMSTTNRRGA